MSALSRKKRILNLALQINENNCSDPTTYRNNNEERNNLESAIERDSNTSSPLPSDAQNIIVEMAEVYHAVFDETIHTDVPELQLEATENHIHTTCQQVVSPSNTNTTVSEWRLLVRWAKTEGEPYLVKNMIQENFFNFKTHVSDKLWNKNLRKQKILWTKVKEVFVDNAEPNKLYIKYDLNAESYECLVLRNDTRNSSVLPVLERAYSSPLKLTKDKYNDLESMCRTGVINATNAIFFRSLPYKSNNANDDLSDESNE
ncbi:uncharacterized protein LOC124641281 [Helicoverpa zea]|uniref:uncharacterized protein LOC124641281 n=1 Tax=Helicoverpa zea TaxID=7113 RepID=UPI001F59D0A6|nr:uncharacterized protein LOC124641281 [Helicoverpa zea]